MNKSDLNISLPFSSLSLSCSSSTGKTKEGRLYQDREWLYQKYMIEKLSCHEIAKICNIHKSTIDSWINKYNIKKRNLSEALKLARKKHQNWGRPKNWIKYKCKYCSKEFYRCKNHNKTIKYCSYKCVALARIAKRTKKKCEICGKKFEIRPCEKGRRFCSTKCMGISWKGKGSPKFNQIQKICEICGKKFNISNYKEKEGLGRFCSQECMIKWRTENFSGINNPNYMDAKKIYICEFCGKEYIEYKRNEGKTRYCSRQCVGSATIVNLFKFGQQKQTLIEKIIDENTKEYINFVGLGNYWLYLDGKNKNPDFKIIGQRKVIEVFGDYWHRNDDPYDLIFEYRKIGYDCLVIWEYEIKNYLDDVLKRINEFIS